MLTIIQNFTLRNFTNNQNRQEDFAKSKGIAGQVKTIRAAIEKDAIKKPWVPASNIQPCHGCGVVGDKRKPCNTCQLNELMRKKHENYQKATKAKNAKLLNSPSQKERTKRFKQKDDDYQFKFGLLKKAAVLVNSERWGDAHKNILEAVKIVQKEQKEEKEMRERKEKKLRLKLQIPLDIPIDYAKLAKEPITKYRLERMGINIPIQKIEIFVEKMCGKDAEAYSKNQFLNTQIMELYEAISDKIHEMKLSLEEMQEKIQTLEGSPEERGRKLKGKRHASVNKMCEKVAHKRRLYCNYYNRKMP